MSDLIPSSSSPPAQLLAGAHRCWLDQSPPPTVGSRCVLPAGWTVARVPLRWVWPPHLPPTLPCPPGSLPPEPLHQLPGRKLVRGEARPGGGERASERGQRACVLSALPGFPLQKPGTCRGDTDTPGGAGTLGQDAPPPPGSSGGGRGGTGGQGAGWQVSGGSWPPTFPFDLSSR